MESHGDGTVGMYPASPGRQSGERLGGFRLKAVAASGSLAQNQRFERGAAGPSLPNSLRVSSRAPSSRSALRAILMLKRIKKQISHLDGRIGQGYQVGSGGLAVSYHRVAQPV